MDIIKDNNIEKEGNLSLEVNKDKKLEVLSFFDKDKDFIFVYKKTEKLASACYIITNLFSDNEPIKWTIRKKVSDFLSFILKYKEIEFNGYSDFAYNAKTFVLEILSLLQISFQAGLISFMNFSILEQEFSNLLNRINSSSQKYAVSANSVKKPLFEALFNDSSNPVLKEDEHQSILKVNNTFTEDNRHGNLNQVAKRSDRQNAIIALLKKKKEINIKDISLIVKNCSEKTIQRELISFISSGVIRKTGQRRWSKYSLI